MMKAKLIGLMGLLLVSLGCGAWAANDAKSVKETKAETVVFLVRHAEKQSEGNDPALTDAGVARANALARLLSDAGIAAIHSTDYTRTKETARPLADVLGLTVQHYDPRTPEILVEQIRKAGGRHLVVGHSNTIPALVNLLGGDGGADIVEATEYDRLYIVTLAGDEKADTLLLRYE